jgi:hypothetical protein
MARVALWQITGLALNRLTETPVDLEKLLEGWIEEDPSLLQPGLAIVAKSDQRRRSTTEGRSRREVRTPAKHEGGALRLR